MPDFVPRNLYSSGVNLAVASSEEQPSSPTTLPLTLDDSPAVDTVPEDRLLLWGDLCWLASRERLLLPSSTSDFDVEMLTAALGVWFSETRAVKLLLLGMPSPVGERGREGRVVTAGLLGSNRIWLCELETGLSMGLILEGSCSCAGLVSKSESELHVVTEKSPSLVLQGDALLSRSDLELAAPNLASGRFFLPAIFLVFGVRSDFPFPR